MKKKYSPLFIALSLLGASMVAGGFTVVAETSPGLPIVKLLNRSFYYYEAKKGDSMAGICKTYGWDLSTLEKFNKDVLLPLDKGTMLFYPVADDLTTQGVTSANTTNNSSKSADKNIGEKPATSEVASVKDNGAVADNKVSSSSTPVDTVNSNNTDDTNVYYVVKHQESIYGIARKNGLTIDELIAMNPSLQLSRPEEGDKLVIGKREAETHTAGNSDLAYHENMPKGSESSSNSIKDKNDPTKFDVSDTQSYSVSGLSTYQALRGDDWSSIADHFGLSEDILKSANPEINKVRRGDLIVIPQIQPVAVEEPHEIPIDEIDGLEVTQEVSIAIVLSDTDSNKDLEFSRGALVAVDRMKRRPFQTRLTILDGEMNDMALTDSLESFGPSYVVTTTSKSLPTALVDYCTVSKVPLINAFDVKDENYLTSPYIVQFQTPTSTFNEVVAADVKEKYGDNHLIIAGSMEAGDTMGEGIVAALASTTGLTAEEVEISGITELELNPGYDYVIYATPSKKDDVKLLLEKINVLRDRNPLCNIKVIGRPSWITAADANKDLFAMNYVYMPTRFYFDAEQSDSRSFIDDYKSIFGHTPLKSYPVYSATAYDIVSSVTPAINDGGSNAIEQPELGDTLQSSIDLRRVSSQAGLMNTDVYVIEYQPFLPAKKRLL